MPEEPKKEEVPTIAGEEIKNELKTVAETSKAKIEDKTEKWKEDVGKKYGDKDKIGTSDWKKPPKSIEQELKFEWDAIHAEMHYVWRSFGREIIGFWDPVEIIFLLILLSLFAFALLGLTVAILPIIIDIFLGPSTKDSFNNSVSSFWRGSGARTFFALCGGVLWLIRQMRKSEFEKFTRKANQLKKVTYIFGTTPYAEQVVFHNIRRLGLEERIAIIADREFLWVTGARGKCPAYIVTNKEEFRKGNMYEKLKFKNAERIFILADNEAMNQDILTGVRQWTDVEVVLLSQFAPGFLQHIDLENQNIKIIKDLEANIEDLVFSLSLDMAMPLGGAVEIPAPRSYIGKPAEMINSNSNLRLLSVIGIRRGDDILDAWEILQKDDFVILISGHNTNLKRTIRVGRELKDKFSPFEIITLIFFGLIFFLLGYFVFGPLLSGIISLITGLF